VKFIPTSLQDAYLIEMERNTDARGFFARLFCAREFEEAGLVAGFGQINNSLTSRRGTLRGLHYQIAPWSEVKVVRCVAGALFDVIADLRPDSRSFGQWYGAVLDAENRLMMYVPQGFAHGFLTLADHTEALYFMSGSYAPQAERGICWNDPWLSVAWPAEPVEISAKDQRWPSFDPVYHGVSGFLAVASTDPS
jgi:dTDP-4-dehydrorhamnose 3,5-epimerase